MQKTLLNVFLSLLFLLSALHGAHAQKYPIDTLQFQGVDKNIVNLVILGDGYTKEQMTAFHEDAKRFTDYFFKTEPFRQYANYFNVFAINTPSEESGAIHTCTADDCPKVEHGHADLPTGFNEFPKRIAVPVANPNTIFGSSFDNYGLHRLVIPHKSAVIERVLADNIPNHTQVVILVNSPFYGGSGGKYATATVNSSSNDIAVHEIGHSFAILADEYWAGNQYAVEGPNRTQRVEPNEVPWKHWLGTNGVGIYGYGASGSPAQWFRPHEFCKMQYLVAPFCPVCQEIFVETIHKKTNPIASFRPLAEKALSADSVRLFSLNLLKPSPNTLTVKWFLNEEQIAFNIDSIYLNPGMLTIGDNILRVEVKDTTDLVRTPEKQQYKYAMKWTINNSLDRALTNPRSTWGDSLQTCFNGHQALTVKEPEAGIQYNWYIAENDKEAFASTTNLLTPKLTTNQTYYLESVWKNKTSKRVPIHVLLLPEIAAPKGYKLIKQKGGQTIRIKLNEKLDERYTFLWKHEDGSILQEWNEFSNDYMRVDKFNNEILVKLPETATKITVQKVDNETTCIGAPLIIELK